MTDFLRTAGSSRTANDGDGFALDDKSALFLMSVTDFSEPTFYETVEKRDDRFAKLVHRVVAQDPSWVVRFAGWLRDSAQIRSRSAAMAAEYHRGLFLAGYPKGAPSTVDVVAGACSRADEPAEILGYWLSRYGRPIPIALRRAVAVAASRLYNEGAALRYDGDTRGIRMGDVVEITHPEPSSKEQSELFRFLVTKRHRGVADAVTQLPAGVLPRIEAAAALEAIPEADRRQVLRSQGSLALKEAGFSWERLSGWLPDGMDAEAWEVVIPLMGYMALLRNLRNFDKAGISPDARQRVIDRLVDPVEVARSRQLPFRFYSAFKNVDSLHWLQALERALQLSTGNVPVLSGRSLVLVDVSGSMNSSVSERGSIACWEVAALFGAVLAVRSPGTDLVAFATTAENVTYTGSSAVLALNKKIESTMGRLGGSTEMWKAADQFYNGHDRIVILSDMQTGGGISAKVDKVPFIHAFNLRGYATTAVDSAKSGRFQYGGFSDSLFTLLPLLEQHGTGVWPF